MLAARPTASVQLCRSLRLQHSPSPAPHRHALLRVSSSWSSASHPIRALKLGKRWTDTEDKIEDRETTEAIDKWKKAEAAVEYLTSDEPGDDDVDEKEYESPIHNSYDYMKRFILPHRTKESEALDAIDDLATIRRPPMVPTQKQIEAEEEVKELEGTWEDGTSASSAPPYMHLDTENPEFIPMLPGSDPSRPTTVRYPFVPLLTTEREINQASQIHRFLHYERLVATQQFLRQERKRHTLQLQRQYRDLAAYRDKLIHNKLPEERTDLKGKTPAVRNLPTNVDSGFLRRYHPHEIPTDTEFFKDVLTEVEEMLRMSGAMSQKEKENFLLEAAGQLRWCYKRMMRDKEKGYYRIGTSVLPRQVAPERMGHPAWNAQEKPVYTRTHSTVLRVGKVRKGGKPQREQQASDAAT